jgi:hypothetical protein
MRYRLVRRRCWSGQNGRLSVGGAERRDDCPPASQPYACVWPSAPQLIHDMGAQHLPGEELWLVGKRRSTGELNYLSYLPPQTTMKQLAGAIKARWISEQGHQKIKEELELDHFEGRSWTGLHRHCLMSMIAFAFLQNQRLKKAKGGKKTIAKPPPQPSLPAIRQEILIALAHPPPSQCPHAVNP